MASGEPYFRHSLRVNDYLCKGCTTCMRSCPTGAIRIRNGKAVVNDNKCVDCGECMQVCPHKAIYIKQDDFGRLFNYRYRVCLVPTTFIGQFEEKYNTKAIYSCIMKLGFTHIYEVEHEMSRMVQLYNMYMDDHPEITTFISPYCPAVTRLIQVRFPSLVDNVIHVRAPLELASRVITKRLMDEGASRQSIGVFYVTPCAAKIAAVKYPVSGKETFVSGVINMDFLYNKVLLMLHDSDKSAQPINHALTSKDVLWSLSGGEAPHFKGAHYAVDGLKNVLDFLEKLEDDAVDAPGLVEMRMCDQGCVGGVLSINNRGGDADVRPGLRGRRAVHQQPVRGPQAAGIPGAAVRAPGAQQAPDADRGRQDPDAGDDRRDDHPRDQAPVHLQAQRQLRGGLQDGRADEEDREGPAGRQLLGVRGAFLRRASRGHRPRGRRHRHLHFHQPSFAGLGGCHPEHLGGPRQDQGNQQGKQRQSVI